MKSRRRCTIYMGTFKTQKMAQRRATSCSAVFQVFKLRLSWGEFIVSQVTVAGKASDLFIPVGVFLAAGHWDWMTYGFAVATTLVCLPILRSSDNEQDPDSIKRTAVLIGVALVLQASLAPLLAASSNTTTSVAHML